MSVTPLREGSGAQRRCAVISPELALVDPLLAASARAHLPERRVPNPENRPSARARLDKGDAQARTALSKAAFGMDDLSVRPAHCAFVAMLSAWLRRQS